MKNYLLSTMNESQDENYYETLQCDKDATPDEIKRSYQRLILSSHPDKNDNSSERTFHLVQQAWSVLRDLEKRKQYDATLKCQEHSEILLYDTVKLSDMTYIEEEKVYTYSCRCGGTYILEDSNFIQSRMIIGCDECSFSIQVDR